MPLEYKAVHSDFSRVVEAYGDWFGRMMRFLLYADTASFPSAALMLPTVLSGWLSEVSDVIGGQDVKNIRAMEDELRSAAISLVAHVQNGRGQPPYEVFDGFAELYDELLLKCARLNQDVMQSHIGLDKVTGLRISKMMIDDIGREMERRARNGRPFCLVIAKIDNDAAFALYRQEQKDAVVKHIAGLVKKCVRSFDDVYRTSETEFVMALKHASQSGGISAINRLKEYLVESPVSVAGVADVTMSYCAAEPVPGDDIEEMIENMRADLSQYDEESGAALEYLEKSPLERFIEQSK